MANGIAHDVQNDLTKAILIAMDGQSFNSCAKGEQKTCLLGDGLHKLNAALNAGGQIQRSKRRAASAMNVKNVVDGSRE